MVRDGLGYERKPIKSTTPAAAATTVTTHRHLPPGVTCRRRPPDAKNEYYTHFSRFFAKIMFQKSDFWNSTSFVKYGPRWARLWTEAQPATVDYWTSSPPPPGNRRRVTVAGSIRCRHLRSPAPPLLAAAAAAAADRRAGKIDIILIFHHFSQESCFRGSIFEIRHPL